MRKVNSRTLRKKLKNAIDEGENLADNTRESVKRYYSTGRFTNEDSLEPLKNKIRSWHEGNRRIVDLIPGEEYQIFVPEFGKWEAYIRSKLAFLERLVKDLDDDNLEIQTPISHFMSRIRNGLDILLDYAERLLKLVGKPFGFT